MHSGSTGPVVHPQSFVASSSETHSAPAPAASPTSNSPTTRGESDAQRVSAERSSATYQKLMDQDKKPSHKRAGRSIDDTTGEVREKFQAKRVHTDNDDTTSRHAEEGEDEMAGPSEGMSNASLRGASDARNDYMHRINLLRRRAAVGGSEPENPMINSGNEDGFSGSLGSPDAQDEIPPTPELYFSFRGEAREDDDEENGDEIRKLLLKVNNFIEPNSAETIDEKTAAAYLAKCCPPEGGHPQGIREIEPENFGEDWNSMLRNEKLRIVGICEEEAEAVELTDPEVAIGSKGAEPCLIGNARLVVDDNGKRRVFGAAIQVDPEDDADPTNLGAINAIHAEDGYRVVLKPLFKALKKILVEKSIKFTPQISDVEFFILGADSTSAVSLQLAAVTMLAARSAGLKVVGKLPLNDGHSVTSSLMNKNELVYTKEEL